MSERTDARTALVLAAHGSHRDPAANELLVRHAAQLAKRGAADEVVAAFHQGSPHFSEVLDGIEADRVLVVPFFTSEGYYTEDVLPAGLRQNRRWPGLDLKQTRPIGVHHGIAGVAAERAARLARLSGIDLDSATLVVTGHGTNRHPHSRRATEGLCVALRRARIAGRVEAAYLDDEPAIEELLQAAPSGPLVVLPFLIGGGLHAERDLPRRLGLRGSLGGSLPLTGRVDGRLVALDLPLGHDPRLLDLVLDVAQREMPSRAEPVGWVALVGAGPGDPGLITVRGLQLLRQADVILHDRLVAPELLVEARAGAQVIDVGKRPRAPSRPQEEIHWLMVEYARKGRNVVRLKGGDPFVFGRGAEELDACREAGVPCTVVPGVSSAIAAPAAAGIPVTERGTATSFAVLTGHTEAGDATPILAAKAAAVAALDTLVILMGRAALPELAAALMAAGRGPETPVACIQEGTTERQRVVTGTLATIALAVEEAGLGAPMVTVVGDVAARAAVPAPC